MKRPYVLAPEDRAQESLRTILDCLFRALRSNVAGVLADTDPEFLHDLRVAARRTRTALTQIRGVLPLTVKETFAPEFKWLGTVTGPLRDLDVHLDASIAYHRVAGVHLDAHRALQTFLEDARRSEHQKVFAEFRSPRFRRLIDDWIEFLGSDPGDCAELPLASSPIVEVAAPQILKAYRRIRKRGASAGPDAPASLLHRLRIDGKKLRYLLEFFADLFPRDTVEQFVTELKQLQGILGEFNDTEVQLAHIGRFNARWTASGREPLDARTSTNRLVRTITGRQHELRTEFVDRFTRFSSAESHRLYKETFKAL